MIALEGFEINRTEITNAQYQRFVSATGHRSAYYGGHPMLGIDGRPVVGREQGREAARPMLERLSGLSGQAGRLARSILARWA